MAFRKRGSRLIVVDGVAYCWRFLHRPTQSDWDLWPGCVVTVQSAGRPGSVLVVRFPQHRPDVAAPCGLPIVPVLPSQVARAIRAAVRAGWRAAESGPQLVMESCPNASQGCPLCWTESSASKR